MSAFWASFGAKELVDLVFKLVVATWAVFLLKYLRQRDKANSAIANYSLRVSSSAGPGGR
jgi:hypothetical protein